MKLWNMIERREVRRSTKNRDFLCLTVLLSALAGGIIWLAAGHFFLPGIDDLLAFLLVPAVLIGFFGGIIYLYNHEFSENRWKAPAPGAGRRRHAEKMAMTGQNGNGGNAAASAGSAKNADTVQVRKAPARS